VPFFVIDRKYAISGAQESEMFLDALEQAWSESHPEHESLGTPDAPVCEDAACG
jgi:predicted DsbA family dithiol-disulfide isomerase